MNDDNWIIFDMNTDKPYLNVSWGYEVAAKELKSFLWPYEPDHTWVKRLILRKWPKPFKIKFKKEIKHEENNACDSLE